MFISLRSTMTAFISLLVTAGQCPWTFAGDSSAGRAVDVKVNFASPAGPMNIDSLASLGQGGLSEEPIWESRAAEVRALRPKVIRIFLQEYFNVLPEKDHYDFSKMDKVVELVARSGAEPLMCICFKPKALFPQIAPATVEPTDWDAWGRLIAAMVRHYREAGSNIHYWEVMNEPDIGESGGCPYLFTAANYPPFYQRTVAAIRSADPQAQVGGPALANADSPVLDALLAHCAEHNVPLDFVSWHIYSSNPGAIRGTIERNKAKLAKNPQFKQVKTILDEWNMDLLQPAGNPAFQPCYAAETIFQIASAGLDIGCYYHIRDYHIDERTFARFFTPGAVAFMAKWWNRSHQNSGLFDFENNVRPAYFSFKLMSRLTGQRLPLESSDTAVHGFATWDREAKLYNLLVWNFSPEPAHVSLALDHLPAGCKAQRIVLDSQSPNPEENTRLHMLPPLAIPLPENKPPVIDLEPFGMTFWMIER